MIGILSSCAPSGLHDKVAMPLAPCAPAQDMHLRLGALTGVVARGQEEMEKKVEKWQEPPPAKQTKVLPAPDMEPKKRRGGRRFRKMKERYGLTGTPPCARHDMLPVRVQ